MERGERAAESRPWGGRRTRPGIGWALALALFCSGLAAPSQAESTGANDRFAKVGGPVSENIDLDKIKALLSEAKGIGIVDKIELRQRLISFTEEFYRWHKGTSEKSLVQLRSWFDELHGKIVALLGPENPQLSSHFERARGALWSAYSDREAFTSTVGRDVVKKAEGDGAGLVGQRYEAPPQ